MDLAPTKNCDYDREITMDSSDSKAAPYYDSELAALGVHELGNAFYAEYGRLVQKYRNAAAGMPIGLMDEVIGCMSDGRGGSSSDEIAQKIDLRVISSCGDIECETMHDALQMVGHEIRLNGKAIFRWNLESVNGWFLVEGSDDAQVPGSKM